MSGTSGNEEEMAEEAEGEAGGGLWQGEALSSPGFAVRLWQRHRARPLQGCKCQHSQGVVSVTPKPHQGDSVPQHKVLVASWMPLAFTLVRSALDRCPPPISVWRMFILGRSCNAGALLPANFCRVCQAPTGVPREALSSLCGPKLLAPCIEAACKGLTRNLGWSQRLLLTLEEREPFSFQFPSVCAPQSTQLARAWHVCMLLQTPFRGVFPQRGIPACSAGLDSHTMASRDA